MNPHTSADPRVQKSLAAISQAFISLLEEKEFHEISAQEIIARAQVSHNTFYKYCRNKNHLAEQLAATIKADFRATMRLFFNHAYPLPAIEAQPPFSHHRRTVLALWQINTRRCRLYQDMLNIAAECFLEHVQTRPDAASGSDRHYQARIFAGIALSSAAYYFRQNRPIPTTAMLRELKEMVAVLSRGSTNGRNRLPET